ncbi:MAG: hypothetical protein CSA32_05275 [Desulfobulbus propionicus]|nr:MAG: hypothetical protein CSA32_05275 [Desulfobulbus propionicus]
MPNPDSGISGFSIYATLKFEVCMKIQFKTPYQREPERIGGIRIPYAKDRRIVARWRWYLIVLIVSSPLLYLLVTALLSYVIVTAPGYLSLGKIPVNSNSKGIVSKILIPVGAEVADGEPLVQLEDPILQERALILEATVNSLQKETAGSVGPWSFPQSDDGLKYLEEQYQLARKIAAYQEKYLNDVRFLKKQGAATIAELRQAESARHSAFLAKSRAERDYLNSRKLQTTTSTEGAERTTSNRHHRLQQLQAEQNAVKNQIARLNQRAPHAGRILEIVAAEGQSVSPGTLLMVLGRTEKPSVLCYLAPKYAQYAKKGRRAQITFPDGSSEKVVVQQDATLVKRLPADLATPIGTRDLLLQVPLRFTEPIPAENRVDGLPVTVRFKSKRNDSLLSLFRSR